jgi:hypothetical protein
MTNSGNFLDLIPEKNCQWDKTEDGRSYLLVPRFKNRWMKKIALKLGRTEYVKVYFDEIGTRVWNLIDGRTTVERIGKHMEADTEKENGKPMEKVYERLTDFLSTLARNKFIHLKNG